ncbi:MAG: sigma-70 family RNA polymerase sigma factor [Clostridium sp.]
MIFIQNNNFKSYTDSTNLKKSATASSTSSSYPLANNIQSNNIQSNNIPITNNEMLRILTLAKNGDNSSKEIIISKYYAYVVLHLKEIFLDGYTFEDLLQIGIESILKSIIAFDIDKPIAGFSSYVYLAIKNNFYYLCRKENKNNNMHSLNQELEYGFESLDLIPSPENLEEIVIDQISESEFLQRLSFLDSEELKLIKFLYLDYSKEKRHLTDYAKLHGKDYYACVVLKRHALRKLKNNYKNFM